MLSTLFVLLCHTLVSFKQGKPVCTTSAAKAPHCGHYSNLKSGEPKRGTGLCDEMPPAGLHANHFNCPTGGVGLHLGWQPQPTALQVRGSGSPVGLGCLQRTPGSALHHGKLLQLQQRRAKRRGSQQKVQAAATASLEGVLSFVQTPLVRDIAAAAFAVLGAKLLVRFFYMLEAMNLIDQNVSRKLVHTLAGPLFVVTWPLFSADPYARCFAAIVPILNIGRLVAVGYGLREDKRAVKAMSRTGNPTELLRGPLYYTVVLLAATVVYWRDSSVGLIVLSLMCGGDGLADLVGRRWGKSNRLPWNPAKSWAGSTAMFCGGLGFALALISYFCQLGYLECDMPSMALTVAAIALAATVIESLPLDSMVDDNLTVPGVAAFLGIMMLQVAVEFL